MSVKTTFRHEERHAGRRVLVLRREFPKASVIDPFFVGYASVESGHPWFGLCYTNPSVDVLVHGDLTFSGELRGETGWWFGFDCAHAGDTIHEDKVDATYGTHITLGYTLHQARRLAEQITDAAGNAA